MILASLLMALMVIVLTQVARWDLRRGYHMDINRYYGQIDGLQSGMTRGEVLFTINSYSNVQQSGNKLIFMLTPDDPDLGFLPRVNHYIHVEFDENGEVSRYYTSDD